VDELNRGYGILKATVRPLEEGDGVNNDAVRIPGRRLYGYIDGMEMEEDSDEQRRLHLMLYCIDADWFDQFKDNLSNMPAIDTTGRDSLACMVEAIVRLDILESLKEFAEQDGEDFHLDFEAVHMSEGWWLEVWVSTDVQSVCPVTVFPPAEGSVDPATIGNTGNEVAGWLHRVARVRPPSRLAKLHRFSHGGL